MESRWNFTPTRLVLLYATGVFVGATGVMALLKSSDYLVLTASMLLTGLAIVSSCRTKRGTVTHPG